MAENNVKERGGHDSYSLDGCCKEFGFYSKREEKPLLDFARGPVDKNLPAGAGDMGSTPDLGRSHMPRNS